MTSGSRVSITPGSLVQLRHKYKNRQAPQLVIDGPGVVIKSLGTDPNAHECFQVLFTDKIITAWDDQLEKLTDSP